MEKHSYTVNLEDLTLRRAKETDDFRAIAKLIYQTDPYIYPYWFEGDLSACEDFLSQKISEDGFIFNYNNIYVAYDEQNHQILGLVVALDKNINLDYDYEPLKQINDRYRKTITEYVEGVIDEVRATDSLYILNCTVLDGYRGRRIGTRLLGHFISQMEAAGFEEYSLDCLLHNLRAKNLYHSMGFKEMKEITGFNGVDDSVEVVSFLRHKGDYLPDEFQEKAHYTGIN